MSNTDDTDEILFEKPLQPNKDKGESIDVAAESQKKMIICDDGGDSIYSTGAKENSKITQQVRRAAEEIENDETPVVTRIRDGEKLEKATATERREIARSRGARRMARRSGIRALQAGSRGLKFTIENRDAVVGIVERVFLIFAAILIYIGTQQSFTDFTTWGSVFAAICAVILNYLKIKAGNGPLIEAIRGVTGQDIIETLDKKETKLVNAYMTIPVNPDKK